MLDVTVPEPLLATDSVHTATNVADTERAWLIVTWQVELEPEQSPDQPVKRDPAEAKAVNVTSVPSSYVSVHVEPQEIEPTSEVSEPDPLFEIERIHTAVNVAFTARACVIETTQVPVPEQPEPDQPA